MSIIKLYRVVPRFVFIAATLALLAACNGDKDKHKALPVSTLLIKETPITFTRTYVGVTSSPQMVNLIARVEGFLIKQHFKDGALVKKDELLFDIDPDTYEAKVQVAKGNLLKARANCELQKITYFRMKKLVVTGDVSRENYDQALAKYQEAIGQVESAEGDLKTAEINLSYTKIHSPTDGLIGNHFVDIGNVVGKQGGNDQLARVVVINPMQVYFSPSIPEYNAFYKYKDNAPFKVEATVPKYPEINFTGTMDFVDNVVETSTSTLLMRAMINNDDSLLRPGVYVDLKVYFTDDFPALLVPKTAIMETQGHRSVYKLDKNNQAVVQSIEIDGEHKQFYVVSKGLKPGDTVILNQIQKLKPHMPVKPTPMQASPKKTAALND